MARQFTGFAKPLNSDTSRSKAWTGNLSLTGVKIVVLFTKIELLASLYVPFEKMNLFFLFQSGHHCLNAYQPK